MGVDRRTASANQVIAVVSWRICDNLSFEMILAHTSIVIVILQVASHEITIINAFHPVRIVERPVCGGIASFAVVVVVPVFGTSSNIIHRRTTRNDTVNVQVVCSTSY